MTTPKRPSLADTLARIDAAIVEGQRCTLTAQRRDVGSTGPFTAERCTRDALPGTDRCSLHTEPVVRDGNTFTVTQPGVYQIGGVVHPYAKAAAPAPPHLPGPPGPTCPGCEAAAARPGWLGRALRRLFN